MAKKIANFHRKHVRAPLISTCMYVDEDHVFKAKTINVSQGGILISELPHVPEINAIPMMISMPIYPRFSELTFEQIKKINPQSFPKKIVKVKARMVRSFGNQTAVEKVFVNFIGCEFFYCSDEFNDYINKYIETYTSNTVYLLSLFETNSKKAEGVELLRKVASLLGYDGTMKLPLLRAKVLHDYQSLESV